MQPSEEIVLWRHPEMSTVAMEILSHEETIDKVYLEVSWWNIGRCHKPYPIGVFQDLTLSHAKLAEFVRFGTQEKVSDSEFERLCVGYNPLIK